MSVRENCLRVQEKLYEACVSSSRDVKDVRLIAVTKYVDTDRIGEALACGIREVGENRVQELKDKQTFFKEHGLSVHMIGQLQLNKVKYVCDRVELIQSVDRSELADKLERFSVCNGAVQDILLQVNIGREPQKGGADPAVLRDLFDYVSEKEHLRVRGLMCVPPACDRDVVRSYFAGMYRIFTDLKEKDPKGVFDTLSMGMSHDYDLAVLEGATMVRVGSAIFGERTRR